MELKTEYEVNDQRLVLEIRENNEDAREHIYKKYSPLIHKEINRVKKKAYILGIDIADLSQEAMLAFTHALNNYNIDDSTKFMTFAILCIRRRLINYIRKFETQKNKAMNQSLSLDTCLEDERSSIVDMLEEIMVSDPLRKLITDEALKEISKNIVNLLNEKERTVLQYDLEGMSVEQIGEIMNLNARQVYNLIYQARRKLKIAN